MAGTVTLRYRIQAYGQYIPSISPDLLQREILISSGTASSADVHNWKMWDLDLMQKKRTAAEADDRK
jgi:hypothetical protein